MVVPLQIELRRTENIKVEKMSGQLGKSSYILNISYACLHVNVILNIITTKVFSSFSLETYISK